MTFRLIKRIIQPMKEKIKTFDLIVVYSSSIAKSAGDDFYSEEMPFPAKGRRKIYNDSYSYLLAKCAAVGLSAAFVTSDDIIGPGQFQSYWTFQKHWMKNPGRARSRVIFQKFSPSTKRQKKQMELLSDSKSVYLFNVPKLKNIFQDKLNTYKLFKEFAIPTIELKDLSAGTIAAAKKKLDALLQTRKYKNDITDSYIIKDKTGSGGYKIYKVRFNGQRMIGDDEIARQLKLDKNKKRLSAYIMQPFISCLNGFDFKDHSGLIDLRVIVLNKDIIQTYIRIAKKGNFKCNEHQGGNLVYMPISSIPENVVTMAHEIIEKLNSELNLKHSLYTLDFIQSTNGNLYFIEGNDGPGLDWDHAKKINERKSKELIDAIVNELKIIVDEIK